ncbi:hypothetical protein LXL04_009023 [Taraxacum kok-saghyz]
MSLQINGPPGKPSRKSEKIAKWKLKLQPQRDRRTEFHGGTENGEQRRFAQRQKTGEKIAKWKLKLQPQRDRRSGIHGPDGKRRTTEVRQKIEKKRAERTMEAWKQMNKIVDKKIIYRKRRDTYHLQQMTTCTLDVNQ